MTNSHDFLTQIAGDGYAFLRMKNEATGEIRGKIIQPSKLDPQQLNESLRRGSKDGWSVWAMVSESSSNRENAVRTRVIWADMDIKSYPRGIEQIDELLATLPTPSLIVNSGGGRHAYWFLNNAVLPDAASKVARSIMWQLGADALHAKNNKMRVPGTVNPKHLSEKGRSEGRTSAVECEVILDSGLTYDLGDLPRDEILDKLSHGMVKQLVLGPQTPSVEDRSAYDYKIVANLLSVGLKNEEVTHLMTRYHASGKVRTEGSNAQPYIRRTIQAVRNKGSAPTPSTTREPTKWVRKTYQQLLQEAKAQFIVDDFLPVGGVGLIAAPPKARKSWTAMDLAHAVATGDHWLNFNVSTARKVLYVQAELPDWMVADRFKQMFGTDERMDNLEFITVPTADLMSSDDVQGLVDVASDFGAELVIIDPIANFWQGDENSASSVNMLFDQLTKFKEISCAVVVVHHTRKTDPTRNERITAQHMRGSNVFFARVDAVLTVSPNSDGTTWADFVLRAAAPRDAQLLYPSQSGRLTTEIGTFVVFAKSAGSGTHNGIAPETRASIAHLEAKRRATHTVELRELGQSNAVEREEAPSLLEMQVYLAQPGTGRERESVALSDLQNFVARTTSQVTYPHVQIGAD